MRLTLMSINNLLTRVCKIALPLALLVLPIAVYWGLTIPTKSTGAAWHNITVGKSTPAEVIAELGIPDRTERWLLSTTYHYYPRPEVYGVSPGFDTPMIVFRGGVVVRIEDKTGIHPEKIYLSDFIQSYGVPDYITWADEYKGDRIVVFLDAGVLLITKIGPQPETTDVLHAYFFRPCSMVCVRLKFPLYVFGQAPPKPEDDKEPSILELEDPWGLTKEQ